jgi:TonB family protein
VRVRADGAVDELALDGSSGTAALDREAEAAFRRAQPFAPPPAGILGQDGHLGFRFGLALDLSAARFLAACSRALRLAWRSFRGLRAGEDRLVVARVWLRGDGSVAEAALEIPSLVAALDASVLEAVRSIAVFPRPPPTVLGAGGRAQFRAAFVMRGQGEDQLRVFQHPPDPRSLMAGPVSPSPGSLRATR